MTTEDFNERLKDTLLFRVDTREKVKAQQIKVLGVLHSPLTGEDELLYEMEGVNYTLQVDYLILEDLVDGKTVMFPSEKGVFYIPLYDSPVDDEGRKMKPIGKGIGFLERVLCMINKVLRGSHLTYIDFISRKVRMEIVEVEYDRSFFVLHVKIDGLMSEINLSFGGICELFKMGSVYMRIPIDYTLVLEENS